MQVEVVVLDIPVEDGVEDEEDGGGSSRLSTNSHSTHSSQALLSGRQSGKGNSCACSSFRIYSMTSCILWDRMSTRHPLSFTVSQVHS